ncbi:MAG TPA: hypothetical protein VK324_05640 [Tepidisphaeraceae bacterium]|nr:hypothetical protein [Tepidisphaeraceae bacterium]
MGSFRTIGIARPFIHAIMCDAISTWSLLSPVLSRVLRISVIHPKATAPVLRKGYVLAFL